MTNTTEGPELLQDSTSLATHVGVADIGGLKQALAAKARASLPREVEQLMRTYGLFACGGFLRSILLGERPKDIDLFASTREMAELAVEAFAVLPGASIGFQSNNAATIYFQGETIQIVRRDCRETLIDTVGSFDFTICHAGIAIREDNSLDWYITDDFMHHTADAKLRYARPTRDEAPASAVRRLLAFSSRGFRPDFQTIAACTARLAHASLGEVTLTGPFAGGPPLSEDMMQSSFLATLEASKALGPY